MSQHSNQLRSSAHTPRKGNVRTDTIPASISRTHSQCQTTRGSLCRLRTGLAAGSRIFIPGYTSRWWSLSGSNRRPDACKATALPAELKPLTILPRHRLSAVRELSAQSIASIASGKLVGRVGVEPTTSRLSGVRSNHLSYRPMPCLSRRQCRWAA